MRMKGKGSIGAALLLSALLMGPGLAFAQEGFDFGADSGDAGGFDFGGDSGGDAGGFDFGGDSGAPAAAVAVDTNSPTYGKYLQAKTAIDNKNYKLAADTLQSALIAGDNTSYAIATSLHYEMGRALYQMGYYQAALSHFDYVVMQGRGTEEFMPTLQFLVLIGRELPGEPKRYSRIYDNYLNEFPQNVDPSMHSEVGLLLGMAAYKQSKLDDAIFFVGHVSQDSEFYPKARYIEGVANVRKYDGENAVESFKEVLRWLDARSELTAEQKRLREYTVAALARVFYQVGSNLWAIGERSKAVSSWNTSIKYYSTFPRSSFMWLESLFEASWAYYRVDNFSKALGLLLTLNSPFFNDQYFPEAMLLQAQIYYTNCHYDRVVDILTEYKAQYGPLKDQMDKLSRILFEPEKVYNFLYEQSHAKGDYDPTLQQVLNAALQDRELKRTMEYIDAVEAERLRVKNDASLFGSPLGSAIEQELESVRTLSAVEAGKIGKHRLERVQDELLRLSNMALDIEIETTEKYAQRLELKEQDPNALVEFEQEVSKRLKADDEHIRWNFDGEYWKDELGYYWYHISSRCGR